MERLTLRLHHERLRGKVDVQGAARIHASPAKARGVFWCLKRLRRGAAVANRRLCQRLFSQARNPQQSRDMVCAVSEHRHFSDAFIIEFSVNQHVEL